MSRWTMITKYDDDEVWELAEQVIEREWLDDGLIRWVMDTSSTEEAIRDSIPSLVSVEPMEPESADQALEQPEDATHSSA